MKSRKYSRRQQYIVPLIIPVLVLVIWFAGSSTGVINTTIIASPASVGARILKMVKEGSFIKNVGISTIRVLKGFCVGAALGLVLGIAMGLLSWVGRLFSLLIAILRPIPPISLIPFFILWLGIGEGSKTAIIAIGTFWSVLLNTIQGFHETDKKLVEVATVLEKSKKTLLFKIVLPSAMPSICTGFRLGISHAWTAVVTAEMIAASAGVGYMIQIAREMQQPDLLLVGIICIGAIGLIIDTVMMLIYKKVIYWRQAD